ncbi:ribokinase [Actinomadura pelletieri DSM 43383]|uniref:Ribokinase n=1 Tax=Actinomadura pelletieri DSM 43383 TaxID=1120940 RepID=A0A495QX51_9ACTN|nr:PfkB family carbohydrate kinase [Actinomadura pelletieri]RKS78771.1 ribokinase [Actinomadura pelletieri DSM 43383]
MTVHVLGAYIRDSFMYCRALPRDGESVAAHTLADSDGGKGANQAVAAARLGVRVHFIGSVGDDAIGDHARELLRREGVGVTGVVRVPDTTTGRSFILVADDANQVVATWPGAADALGPPDTDRSLARLVHGDVLSVQGEIPLAVSLHAARAAAAARAAVVCNASPVEQFLDHPDPWDDIDVLIVNDVEGHDLLGTGAHRPAPPPAEALGARLGVPTVVVTHGANGATLFDGRTSTHLPAPEVDAVDPTGAGDAFAGAFAAELSKGESLYHSCQTAIAVASYSVTGRFCVPSYPTRKDIEAIESELAVLSARPPNSSMKRPMSCP